MLLPVRVHVQAHFYSTNQANIKQILWSTKGQEKSQGPQTSLVLLRLMGSLLILRLRADITKQLRFFPSVQLVGWSIASPSYRPNAPPIPDSYEAPKTHFIYPYGLGNQPKIPHISYWAHGPCHFITSIN